MASPTVNKGGRPTNDEVSGRRWMREQFQQVNEDLNELEELVEAKLEDKQDYFGRVGFLAGSLQVRLANIEDRLGIEFTNEG